MADQSEVYAYILKVENEEKVKQAAAAAALAEQKFKALYATLGAGHAQTQAAAGRLVDLNKQLAGAGGGSRDFGRAALEASRGLEDLQYGVAGVLNNLPGLVAALGGPAGLAAIVSGVAVTGKILYDHWDDLAGLFGQSTTRTQAEQMEELGKKTAKTAEETGKLLKYEQDRKNLEAQRGPTSAQSDFTRQVNEAVREAPELEVRRAIQALHGPAIEKAIPAEIEQAVADAEAKAEAARTAGGPQGDVIRAIAAERLRLAAEARNTARTEALNKAQAEAFATPEALEVFLKRAVAGNLLRPDAVQKLRDAGAGPEAEAERLAGEKFEDRRRTEDARLDAAIKETILGKDTALLSEKEKELEAARESVRSMEAGVKAEQALNDERARLEAAIKEVVQGYEDTALLSPLQQELKAARESAKSLEEGIKAEQKIAAEKARLLAAIEEVTTGQRNLAGMSDLELKLEAAKLRAREVEQRATSGTGFDRRAEFAAVRGLLAGGSRGQVTVALGQRMFRELRAQGVAPQRAFEMARDQSKQFVGKALDDVLTGGGGRPAQRIGMADFARSVESAGTMKMVDATTQMKVLLAQKLDTIANNINRVGP